MWLFRKKPKDNGWKADHPAAELAELLKAGKFLPAMPPLDNGMSYHTELPPYYSVPLKSLCLQIRGGNKITLNVNTRVHADGTAPLTIDAEAASSLGRQLVLSGEAAADCGDPDRRWRNLPDPDPEKFYPN